MPNSTADRALKLVTKSVQNLANLVEFKTKESFMIYLNHFIKEHLPRMRHFVDQIAVRELLDWTKLGGSADQYIHHAMHLVARMKRGHRSG